MRAIVLPALLGASLALGACGIKGPLYLPDVPAPRPAAGADHSKGAGAPSAPTSVPDPQAR